VVNIVLIKDFRTILPPYVTVHAMSHDIHDSSTCDYCLWMRFYAVYWHAGIAQS